MSTGVAVSAASAARPDLEVDGGRLIDWDPSKYGGKKCLTTPASKICYHAGTDQVYVGDRKKDGYGSVGWWKTPNRRGQCINNHGAGKWVVCPKDFPENQNITFFSPWDGDGYKMTTRT
ncbi:hypothetical protein [Streptomyces sirii]|uniref:hypothetical protein n=1 Tax=Streptomyces sirii TaxID=3127701 RepID=UPI003D35E0C0